MKRKNIKILSNRAKNKVQCGNNCRHPSKYLPRVNEVTLPNSVLVYGLFIGVAPFTLGELLDACRPNSTIYRTGYGLENNTKFQVCLAKSSFFGKSHLDC